MNIYNFFRHYQKGLRLDPEHGELKKAYFGLKNLLKKTKSVSPNNCFLIFLFVNFSSSSLMARECQEVWQW